MSTRSGGYSSHSAVDFSPKIQMSQGGGAGLRYNNEDSILMGGGGYQGGNSQRQQITTLTRSMSRQSGPDPEVASLRSLRIQSLSQQPTPVGMWMTQDGSEGSLVSDHDATYMRQDSGFGMSNGYASTYPRQPMYSAASNGFSSGAVQTSMTLPSMRRSLSGTLARSGGGVMEEEAYARQSFKGPAQRTISRIAQNKNRGSVYGGSVQGGGGGGGFIIGGGSSQSNLAMVQQGRLSRAASMRSVISVGKGKDVFDNMDMAGSMGNLSG